MAKIFRFVGEHHDEDTTELHTKLAKQAEQGDLVGSIVIPFYSKGKTSKQYMVATSGWATQNSTFSCGMLLVCLIVLALKAASDAGLTDIN